MVTRAYDLVVVGGGLIGTAVARELLQRNNFLKLALVEKEKCFAAHQSGHNSGVIHSGIYYSPGSLKAKLCVEGLDLIYAYCDKKQIPYKKCGKLIVAVKEEELPRLNSLLERGKENGVQGLTMLSSSQITEVEPKCQGLKAIWSPNTGIVDWAEVNNSYGIDCKEKGASIYFNFNVINITEDSRTVYPIIINGETMSLSCKYVITCGGLFSDKLAALTGCSLEPRIVPFRGDYLLLNCEKPFLRTNIYPVPEPGLPFLGVHFTPRLNGTVWLGPNAIPALKREGYSWKDVSFPDVWNMVTYCGFWKLAAKYYLYGMQQIYEAMNISAQVLQLQKYVPSLQQRDISRGASGVRAQALDKNGHLVDDFVFDSGTGFLGDRILHVRNAPSPAATSSLAIAKVVAETAEKKFNLRTFHV